MDEVYIILVFFDSGDIRGFDVVSSVPEAFFYFHRDMLLNSGEGR